MAKSFIKEYRLELASFMDALPSYLFALEELSQPFGTWAYWLVVLGPLLLVGGGWWLYDYVKKTRELARLIDTPSKAKFVRRLDDIEYLAWSLPKRFEDQVIERKRKLNVK
jgi:hypothetical protein